MEEGRIPDHALSASSSYELKSVDPQNARIRQEKNGGAWCPKAQINKEIREFIEIDLNDTYLITATETQGRFGNGQGQEYAENFSIEYWRPGFNTWITYKDSKGNQIMSGNVNTYLVVRQKLELPFVATKIRFIPFSEHPRTVCMRVELFGCLWNQHLVQYSAPRPSKFIDLGDNLDDISYDGVITDTMLFNGLGQLVDGIYAAENNQWVGWSNRSLNGKPLEIVFEFGQTVKLTEIRIHVNNMFERDLELFSHIEISHGLTQIEMRNNRPISQIVQKTHFKNSENSDILVIDVDKYHVKFVSVRFQFSRQWIWISEISFDVRRITSSQENDSKLESVSLSHSPTISASVFENGQDGIDVRKNDTTQVPNRINKNPENNRINNNQSQTLSTKNRVSNNHLFMGLLMGIILVVFGIVLCTMFLLVRSRRKKVSLLHKHTTLIANHNNKGAISIDLDDLKRNLSLTPIMSNGVTQSKLYLSDNNNYNFYTTQTEHLDDIDYSINCNNDDESDSDNSSVYHEPYKLLKQQQQQNYGHFIHNKDASEATLLTSKNDDVNVSKSMYKLKSLSNTMKSFRESFYASTDIFKVERTEQNFTPGIFTSIKLLDDDGSICEGVPENVFNFPRHRLKIIEKIGEGDFGMVHICEVEKMPDLNGMTSCLKKQLVIVKSLWRESTETYRDAFLREINQLSSNLNDENFAKILGICSQDEPVCAILEYSEFGELPKYFQLIRSNSPNDSVLLSLDSLLFISFQIASGMTYLESSNLVHRDLAARNCIIGRSFKVKISDHAMYCDKYHSDYYVNDSKSKMPVRWMSWESLLMGNQSSKSDVWSFAVTVWEIFTYCSQQPFAEMTNEQVIENCNRNYQKPGTQVILTQPSDLCTDDLYDVMLKCWSRNFSDRPSFCEINQFFHTINVNFLHCNH